MITTSTKSSEQTQALAAAVAAVMQPRDLVMLVGEMGSGKTTFTQGFGTALGVDEQITSPTFVLMRSYEAPLPLHHVDLYRLDHLQEVIDLGLLELLDEGGVALVEWGDVAAPVMPRDFLEVRLEFAENEDVRHIKLRGVGPQWSVREKVLVDCVRDWIVEEGDQS